MTGSWQNSNWISFLLLIFSITGCSSSVSVMPLGFAKRGDFVQRVTIAGMIVPHRKTLISTPYNGYVKKIFVKVGDEVVQGDPIVSVAQSLQSIDTIFPLRAPFPGTVVHVEKSEGEYVKEGDPKEFMVRIDDLSKFYILAYAPEIDRVKIKKGQETIIKASAILNRTFNGVIRDIALSAREKERDSRSTQAEFPVKVEIINPDDRVRPGMSVVLDIIVQRKKGVLMLGHQFVHRDGEVYYVLLKDGKRRDIEVGVQNEDVFEIISGLKENEPVRMVNFAEISEPE